MEIIPASLSFSLEMMKSSKYDSFQGKQKRSSSWTMIVITKGEGTVAIKNSVIYHVMPSACIVVHPHSLYEIKAREQSELCLTEFVFTVNHSIDVQLEQLFTEASYQVANEYKLLEMLKELGHQPDNQSASQLVNYHLLFQRFILFIFQHDKQSDQTELRNTRQAVADSLMCIHQRYWQQFTVEELAKTANIGRWQYTQLFTELTGKSPLNYITDVRMKMAKSLLLTSRCVKAVANQVGYRDPYYFSRRFKQATGIAPGNFVRAGKATPRLICSHYAIESSHVGVEPIAATNHAALNKAYKTIGETGHLNLEKIRSLAPDLIMIHEIDKPYLHQLSDIAPTAYIPYYENDPLQSYQRVADVLGREKQAEQWLIEYEEKVGAAQQKINSLLTEQETVGLYLIHGGKNIIRFHAGNIGHALFRSLKLRPPEAIAYEMKQDASFQAMEISIEEFKHYRADIMLFVVFPDKASEQLYRKLQSRTCWSQFNAVQTNSVYQVRPESWFTSDAMSMPKKIDQVVGLLSDTRGCSKG